MPYYRNRNGRTAEKLKELNACPAAVALRDCGDSIENVS